jgi:hypothetical protein
MREVRSQVENLADRSELIELLYRLGATLDEKRLDDLRTIYIAQAVFEFSDNPERGDLQSAIDNAGKMGRCFARTHHVMTNPIVDLNGDNATLRANLVATHVYREDKPGEHYDVGMVYHFRAIRTVHGWRFSHVKLERIWSNGDWDAPQRT